MTPTARHRSSRRASASTARLERILNGLRRASPLVKVELNHTTPWELLVATILSAQCTDQRVNQVTPRLFQRYRRPADYAKAEPAELEEIIRPTGFYKSKTKSLIRCAEAVSDRFGGKVPDTMEELTGLPGVGRKTANVILGHAFGKPAIVVDTHVKRVAARLGLTAQTDPTKIEFDLQATMPPEQWTEGSQRLLLHGRYVCLARTPKCRSCPIYVECHWKGKPPR
jgi:endonuclease-3